MAYLKARHPEKYGTIESIQLIKEKDASGEKTDVNKGYGFVFVSSEDMADKMAIQHANFTFGGRKIELKKNVASGGGEGGRGRGRGRGGDKGMRGGRGGGQFQGYGAGDYGGGYGGQWAADPYAAGYGGYDAYGGGYAGGYAGGYGGGYGAPAAAAAGAREEVRTTDINRIRYFLVVWIIFRKEIWSTSLQIQWKFDNSDIKMQLLKGTFGMNVFSEP